MSTYRKDCSWALCLVRKNSGTERLQTAEANSRLLLHLLPDVSKVLQVCGRCVFNRIVVAHASAAMRDTDEYTRRYSFTLKPLLHSNVVLLSPIM